MSWSERATPAVSVVVPTYNRCDMLRRTLETLMAQQFPRELVEVVVADDGSSDGTREVVRSFGDAFPIKYYFQEDRGFRAARVRNGGARLASAATLLFVDTGVLAGSDLVRAHSDAQMRHPAAVVLGYTYGYDPYAPDPSHPDVWNMNSMPESVVEMLGSTPSFQDLRQPDFLAVADDLGRLAAPWALCWTLNMSVRAEDFWAVGGFDDEFQGWGMEDIEVGYRLHRRGVSFHLSRSAWGIETPHERDMEKNLASNARNVDRFLDKHRQPSTELFWAVHTHDLPTSLEDEIRTLREWSGKAGDMDVRAELVDAIRSIPREGRPQLRVAVLGCGGELPEAAGVSWTAIDFDANLLSRAVADGRAVASVHAIGVRLPFADRTFDCAIVTSRLAGLWDPWGRLVSDEMHRVAGAVHVGWTQPEVPGRRFRALASQPVRGAAGGDAAGVEEPPR